MKGQIQIGPTEYIVHCAHTDCHVVEIDHQFRMVQAEETFKGAGWAHTSAGWYCPAHAPIRRTDSPRRSELKIERPQRGPNLAKFYGGLV